MVAMAIVMLELNDHRDQGSTIAPAETKALM